MIDGIGIDEETLLTRNSDCEEIEKNINHCCEKCDGSFSEDKQDFRDADMVVIRKKPIATMEVDGAKTTKFRRANVFEAFCIYGSRLVTTTISGTQINNLRLTNSSKIIWAHKKPYVLNGDSRAS